MWKSFAIAMIASSAMPATAMAGDSTHEICVGIASIDTGPSKEEKKFTIRYDEERSGADKRKTTLRTLIDGRPYTGSAISADPKVSIKLANKSDVLFDGTVEYIEGSHLQLEGTYARDGRKRHFHAVLSCTDKK